MKIDAPNYRNPFGIMIKEDLGIEIPFWSHMYGQIILA